LVAVPSNASTTSAKALLEYLVLALVPYPEMKYLELMARGIDAAMALVGVLRIVR
jgi:hypothetical protein